MAEMFTEIDQVLLNRWSDAVSFREALEELEGRLAARFEAAAESVRPWVDEQGYGFFEIETKYARINVARDGWVNKKRQQPWVWFMIDALLPYGFRRVDEEHPYVWIDTRNLDRDERSTFQEHLTNRLRGRDGGWVNEDCSRDHPAGRYIMSHGDRERLALAQSSDAMAAFIRENFTPILALGDDVEAALRATRGR
jgi:hypothetical protein